jgi:hypothetical protein
MLRPSVATGIAVLEVLLREAAPINVVFRQYLDDHELYEDYSELAERLHFERTIYERYGKTAANTAEYARHVRPVLERLKSIEQVVAREFRAKLMGIEQIGFGIRTPMREPVRYALILPSTWAVLQFAFADDDASSDGIKYVKVCVASTAKLSAADRRSLAAELKREEAARTSRTSRTEPAANAAGLAEAIDKLSASISSQPVFVSVRHDTVDVRLVDVHPDLMRRAAGEDNQPAAKTESSSTPSDQQGRKGRPPRKNSAGRPTMKAQIYRLQLERWAASHTAGSCAEEARQIEKILSLRFPHAPNPGEPSVPQWESIENKIRHRYRRLQNTRNAIKYLMGIRPN